jgi:hypothetical protein
LKFEQQASANLFGGFVRRIVAARHRPVSFSVERSALLAQNTTRNFQATAKRIADEIDRVGVRVSK